MTCYREPLSPFLWGYIKNLLSESSDATRCKDLVREALRCTCHAARIRSVAYAAGYCAYYARMIEKMGVFEVVSGSISGKGKTLHKLLALTSQDLFSRFTLYEVLEIREEVISKSIERAISALGLGVEKEIKGEAIEIMKKLINALSRAQRIMRFDLSVKLFPIVEQEFIDFDDHMYGAPDLILEDLNNKKAIVVEWKTRLKEKESMWSDVDIAQTVAYAVMESRRLGIKGLKEVFESILGIDVQTAYEIVKCINRLKNSQGKTETPLLKKERDKLIGLVMKASETARGRVRVLPLIIGSSRSFPPHPMMYRNGNAIDNARRFAKLYNIIKKVIVAAEHLTLQLTNAESLLAEVKGLELEKAKEQLHECCRSGQGYLAFNYTPYKILPCGIPREQKSWPCKTKNRPFCSFAGEDNACMFYFGPRKREDFETIMWRLRYKVFEEKERSLINYKAMDILFRKLNLQQLLNKDVKDACKGFTVNIAGETAYIEKNRSVIFYVRAHRGTKSLVKIRFDIAKLDDIDLVGGEEALLVRRKLREIEKKKEVIGTVKRSVSACIIEPQVLSPLLSINTFLMVRDCDVEEDEVLYYLYSPSLVLRHNFELFKHYIEILRNDPQAKLLLFEAPANLTIMELRAIDALQRYIYSSIKRKNREELTAKVGISGDELDKEIEIIKKEINESKKRIKQEERAPLHEIMERIFKENTREYK